MPSSLPLHFYLALLRVLTITSPSNAGTGIGRDLLSPSALIFRRVGCKMPSIPYFPPQSKSINAFIELGSTPMGLTTSRRWVVRFLIVDRSGDIIMHRIFTNCTPETLIMKALFYMWTRNPGTRSFGTPGLCRRLSSGHLIWAPEDAADCRILSASGIFWMRYAL